jgi:glycosyltransferase involved in cell wall biosynthesis
MKIGIFLHPYNEKKPAGLGEYIYSLTKSLIENDKKNSYVVYLKNKPSKNLSFSGVNWEVYSSPIGGPLWRDFAMLLGPKVDVSIFNTPILPIFYKPKRAIVIALDFAYYLIPTQSLREYISKKIIYALNYIALKRAENIVSISEATKKDAIRLFGIGDQNIKVIYPGIRNISEQREDPVDIHKPFFLFIGVIKERKNVYNIVKAFIDAKKKSNLKQKLVIAGKGSGNYFNKIMDLVERSGIKDEIIFLDYITDNQLVYLYKNADCLVFPSLIEGFGMPILEAMSCGLPVITSNSSSLAEVGGDAAILVDPNNIEDISSAMINSGQDEKLRLELRKKGQERIKLFSWKKTAEEFYKVINENISNL